jgi:hypothetical protein
MSPTHRRRRARADRHLCAACRERKARFKYQGHIRADRDHVLCFQCFRSQLERLRARRLAAGAGSAPPRPLLPLRPRQGAHNLTSTEREHRARMLAHLESTARYASVPR